MPDSLTQQAVLRTDEVVKRLRHMLDDYRRRRGHRPAERTLAVPSGLEPLDHAMPHGGLPTGAVTEILFAAPGLGAMSLALGIARRATDASQTVAMIDTQGDFYPPAAARLRLSVQQLLVIQPKRAADAMWATDQCLRCPAVGAVVARLGKLRPSQSRRLQLAARSAGNLGLIVKPLAAGERTFAAVQIALEPATADEQCNPMQPLARLRRVRITVLKVREGMPAKPFLVGLDDEAGFVPLHSAGVARSPRTSRRRGGT